MALITATPPLTPWMVADKFPGSTIFNTFSSELTQCNFTSLSFGSMEAFMVRKSPIPSFAVLGFKVILFTV